MKHRLLETYEFDFGLYKGITILTERGVFAGMMNPRREQALPRPTAFDTVDIWHPVPRWMRPWQVLESLV